MLATAAKPRVASADLALTLPIAEFGLLVTADDDGDAALLLMPEVTDVLAPITDGPAEDETTGVKI